MPCGAAGRSARAAECAATNPAITASFSAGRMEQVTYKSDAPSASNSQARASSCDCCSAKRAMSAARRRCLMSGWRRMTPLPLHGASTIARSKLRPRAQPARASSRKSAATTSAESPRRARFCSTAPMRSGKSTAVTRSCGCASSNKQVLPPGAAQPSSTRPPARNSGAAAGATSCAASSCTEARPAAKPGISSAGSGASSVTPTALSAVGAAPTPARASMPRYSSRPVFRRLTRRVSGGLQLLAAKMSPHCSGQCMRISRCSQSGNAARAAAPRPPCKLSRARKKFRSTALINPPAQSKRVPLTASTLSLSAAWSGTRMCSIWWQALTSKKCTARSRLFSGVFISCASIASKRW